MLDGKTRRVLFEEEMEVYLRLGLLCGQNANVEGSNDLGSHLWI